jgi:isoleucyl-tRNA synthetase
VLVRFSQAMAPFTPFLAEELYRKLTGEESVHLTDWPEVGHANELVLDRMTRTREIIEQGLGLRMQKSDTEQQTKVRQPLSTLTYGGEKLDEFYESIIAEEVNVKQVTFEAALSTESSGVAVTLDKTITPELRREGLAREVIRHVQAARKNAGLNVDDRIVLSLEATNKELVNAIAEHEAAIAAETLATGISTNAYDHTVEVNIEGETLNVSLEKAV